MDPEISMIPGAAMEILENFFDLIHALGRMTIHYQAANHRGGPRKNPVGIIAEPADGILGIHEGHLKRQQPQDIGQLGEGETAGGQNHLDIAGRVGSDMGNKRSGGCLTPFAPSEVQQKS
jgi:hypothetical protein